MLLLALAGARCSNPTTPTSTTSNPVKIACPQPIVVVSPLNVPTSVRYGDPIVSAGVPPVTVACAPTSGSVFPLGASSVTCKALDARLQSASCSFNITVMPPPRISATNFMAFGDSITAGEINDDSNGYHKRVVDPTTAYPTKLKALLAQRYTSQQFIVTNDGASAHRADEDLPRLVADLSVYRPSALLLDEGVNDLDEDGIDAIPTTLAALKAMIIAARSQRITVFIGTLLPERPNALRALDPTVIAPFNSRLVPMAASQGAIVVDLYSAFIGNLTTLIGPDGLHPNAAGYERMAELFFDSIRSAMELPAVPTLTVAPAAPLVISRTPRR